MKLRRKFIQEAKGDPVTQKALAVAICIKACIGRSSTLRDYSTNKLHRLTGISAKTLTRYIPILEDMGIVAYSGKRMQHMVIQKLASHSPLRNIVIDKFDFSSFRSVYYSLRAFLALSIQHRKDFIRRTIQTVTDPHNWEDFKSARATLKRLVKKGIVDCIGGEYKENGISYRRIAKETGNCIRTAEKIIDYAVSMGWVQRIKNYKWWSMPNVHYRHVEGFTFTTSNYGYVISSNSYDLSFSVSQDLGFRGW
jgi:hypothetical protein